MFFFSGSSHLGKNYQRKSFIKYHLHKKSRTYTLYMFRGQILENKKTPEGVYAGCVSGRKNYRYVQWQWIGKFSRKLCRRDGDVLLRTNTLEDKLHTRVPLLLKTKLYLSILPPYMLGVWGSSLKFAFLY